MKKILFVGNGNTCRSVMAEYIFNSLCKRLGIEGYIGESCGMNARKGMPPGEYTINAVKEMGIDIKDHKASLADVEILSSAEKIYCMVPSVAASVITYLPGLENKVEMLGEGIPSPEGASMGTFINIREMLEQEILEIIGTLK